MPWWLGCHLVGGGWLGQIGKVGDVKRGCEKYIVGDMVDEFTNLLVLVLHFSFEDACGRTRCKCCI